MKSCSTGKRRKYRHRRSQQKAGEKCGLEGRTVHAFREEQPIVFEEVDLIVVTTGMKSVDDLAHELDGAVPVTLVGDAKHVGNAQGAITDAYLTCREI